MSDVQKQEKLVMATLLSQGSQAVIDANARLGITPNYTVGIKIPDLRVIAKKLGKNHTLALTLWDTQCREAQIIASLIAVPEKLSISKIRHWIKTTDSWDIVDAVCMNLLWKSEYVNQVIDEYSLASIEMSKRYSFVLIACLARYRPSISRQEGQHFLSLIKTNAGDERRYVHKAVNWALREIGKKHRHLYQDALSTAEILINSNSKVSQWVGRHAKKELSKW